MLEPLILNLRSDKGSEYIYDACSNLFFVSSDPLVDVIKLYNVADKEEIIGILKSRYKLGSNLALSYYNFVSFLINKYMCFYSSGPQLSRAGCSSDLIQREVFNVNQLVLEVTQKCNFRCRYCSFSGNYAFSRTHAEISMPFEVAKKSIDYYCDLIFSKKRRKRSKIISLGFYGGEPFLEFPLIKDCIDYARQKANKTRSKCFFLITTNGSIMTDDILKYLSKNDVKLNISVDGPPEVHNQFRVLKDGAGSFDKVWHTINRIRRFHPKYYRDNLGFQVTPARGHNLIEMKAFFDDRRYFKDGRITINPVYENDVIKKYKQHPDYEKNMKLLYSEFKERLIHGNFDNEIFLKAFFKRQFSDFDKPYFRPLSRFSKYTSSCYPGCTKLFVSSDGYFHACEKINRSFPIGDHEHGLDIQKMKKIWSMYTSTIWTKCSTCESVHYCHICMAIAGKSGYFDARSQCEYNRKTVSKYLSEYLSIMEENGDAFKKLYQDVL